MILTVRVTQAINLLEEHREDHQAEYALQIEGYRAAMKKYGEEVSQWGQGERSETRPREPTRPVDYTESYDELILALSLHTEAVIDLDESDQKNIIHDQFGWSGNFASSTAMYVEEQRRIKVRKKR